MQRSLRKSGKRPASWPWRAPRLALSLSTPSPASLQSDNDPPRTIPLRTCLHPALIFRPIHITAASDLTHSCSLSSTCSFSVGVPAFFFIFSFMYDICLASFRPLLDLHSPMDASHLFLPFLSSNKYLENSTKKTVVFVSALFIIPGQSYARKALHKSFPLCSFGIYFILYISERNKTPWTVLSSGSRNASVG